MSQLERLKKKRGGEGAEREDREGERGERARLFNAFPLTIHPLFLLVGLLCSFTGRLLLFLVFTLSALLHECGHAIRAASFGYRLDRILLMPYGAVVKGDLSGIRPKEEIGMLLAGPLVSGATAVFFVALWWFFPDCYPYTEDVVTANASLFFVNLLPAYPLDGGRLLLCLLKTALPEPKAKRLCRIVGGVFASVLLLLFALEARKGRINVSLALFALLLAVGCFSRGGGEYGKICFSHRRAFARGVEIRRVAVDKNCTVKKLLKFFSKDKYLIADVYSDEGEYVASLRQEEIEEIFEKRGIYIRIDEFLGQKRNFHAEIGNQDLHIKK